MDCKTFKGGYCEKAKMYVPRGWCVKRCKFGKNLTISKKPKCDKPKKPNVPQMAIHFAKAMAIWTAKGFPVCSKEMYTARREVCAECSDTKACPFCGCNLWLKTAVKTEKCKLNKWKE